jgi:5'-nucleotidase
MSRDVRFLLTNDDGVAAEGLAALLTAARQVARPLPLVVAPEQCHSGGSHKVTTHSPLRLRELEAGRMVTNGTPADCVRLALSQVAQPVDWVLAGLNHGGNLGADVYLSGTVAAVREGVLHGKPGAAFSYYHRKGVSELDWPRAAGWVAQVLATLLERPAEPGTFWNINLPNPENLSGPPPIVFCDVDPSPLLLDYRQTEEGLVYSGNYHQRPRVAGKDVDRCFAGNITVSLVRLH